MHNRLQVTLVVVACMALLPALASAGTAALPPYQSGTELLKDPGLDGPVFQSQCCGADGQPIKEVQVAEGWTAWWLDLPPAYVVAPDNCDKQSKYSCYWMRPQFMDSARTGVASRIRSGGNSQMYFSSGMMHEAGLYQRVTGITPGSRLSFSIYMSAWMCMEDSACPGGLVSDQPSTMHLRVGLDPTGGTDPFSANIVWSGEMDSFDRWSQYTVEAVAQADAVTVFTHSRPEWLAPRSHNDVYVDEASLVKVGEGTVAPTATATSSAGPAQPTPTSQPDAVQPTPTPATALITETPAATSTPVVTRTPRPDGAVVHVIQSGDTLYAISLQYNVPLDDLYRLNDLTRESILSVGQEIVVQVGQGTVVVPSPTSAPKPTNTPQAAPSQSPLATPTLLATAAPSPASFQPTVTPVQGGLCLAAFEDTNGNTLRDGNEPSLAGVTFIILSGGSDAARYTADGSTLSYCLTTLPPGAYSVEVTLPSGYVAAFEKTDVALASGQRVDLVVAAQRGEKGSPTPAAQPTQASAPARSNTALIAGALFAAVFLILIGISMVVIRRGK